MIALLPVAVSVAAGDVRAATVPLELPALTGAWEFGETRVAQVDPALVPPGIEEVRILYSGMVEPGEIVVCELPELTTCRPGYSFEGLFLTDVDSEISSIASVNHPDLFVSQPGGEPDFTFFYAGPVEVVAEFNLVDTVCTDEECDVVDRGSTAFIESAELHFTVPAPASALESASTLFSLFVLAYRRRLLALRAPLPAVLP